MKRLLPAILFSLFTPLSSPAGEAIVIDDFENGLKQQWETRTFKGKTLYSVIKTGDGHALKADSNASASALIYRYGYDLREYPLLTWRWKVEGTIRKGDEAKKAGDDYAARVYVIFPHLLPPLTKSINYIWANRLPKGKYTPNPYYSKAIMVAVESGDENTGRWVTEQRNVYEDFKMLFGGEPPPAGGIAIMTDTDNTGESAVAFYDDIRIEKK